MMVSPERMKFMDWALQLTVDFPYDKIPIPYDEKDWVEWAQRVIESPSFAGANTVLPASFSGWQDWARYLYATLG